MFNWVTAGGRSREFEAVALVHLDALYQYALRLTHNRSDAEDLVQEACLRGFRSFHRFNPGTNCRAWLFTILRNAFLSRVRQAGHDVLGRASVELESEAAVAHRLADTARAPAHPEEEFFQTVLHGDVDRALKTLPLPFREVVILADLEGLSYREVAQVVGCPMGTVMSRLSRGRGLLRQALARCAREHGYVKEPE